MKICRFKDPETQRPSYGMIVDGEVFTLRGDLSAGDLSPEGVEPSIRLAEAQLLPPVAPSKVVCVGRNYREHAAELGNAMPTEPLQRTTFQDDAVSSGQRYFYYVVALDAAGNVSRPSEVESETAP